MFFDSESRETSYPSGGSPLEQTKLGLFLPEREAHKDPFEIFFTKMAEKFGVKIENGYTSSLPETLTEEQKKQLKRIYLFSLVFGNPLTLLGNSQDLKSFGGIGVNNQGEIVIDKGQIEAVFKRGQNPCNPDPFKIIVEGPDTLLKQTDRWETPYTLFCYTDPVRREFEKKFGLKIDPNGEIEQNFREILQNLDPSIILQTLKDSGFNQTTIPPILREYLERRRAWLENLSVQSLSELKPEDDDNWESIDKELSSHPLNPIKDFEAQIDALLERIKSLRANIEEPQKPRGILEKLKDRFTSASKQQTDVISESDDLPLELKRLLNRLKEKLLHLKVEKIGPRGIKISDSSMDPLRSFACVVTRKQIRKFESLINEMRKSRQLENLISEYELLLEDYKQDRMRFERLCEERSRAVVCHVTRPEWLKAIVKSGELRSSLYQASTGESPNLGSLYTERGNLLPQIVFSVNGVDFTYAGEDTPIKETVALIAPYPIIAQKGLWVEHESTSASAAKNDGEFHLFNPEDPSKGIALPLDDFIICVPESKKQYWTNFLSEIGKDDQWIEAHLMCYPQEMYLDTFIRHFFKLPSQPKGGFVPTDKVVTVHNISPEISTILMLYQWIPQP